MKKSKPRKSRQWNPGRPTIKGLQAELDTVRELRTSDSQYAQRQREELEHLRAAMSGAQAEVERLRKDILWYKHLIENLVEKPHSIMTMPRSL